jgi:hypothetical protein
MVDVGKRQPLLILAADAADAAFQALAGLQSTPESGVVTVVSRSLDGETDRSRFLLAERRCRVCGCKGCCWMAWDLCSMCVFEEI